MKSAEAFDRRVFGRRRTNIQASVRIGYRIVPCTIKDLSEGGALLEFETQMDLPARLWLSWPGQSNEVVCEVRHTRRNSAGVQFTRPQALNLKAAVTPAEVFRPAPAAHDEASTGASGNDLVSEHRRALRQVASASASHVGDGNGPPMAQLAPEPPRDLSALKASLEAAALAIVAEREARRVPRPLAARVFAGSAAEPPHVLAPTFAPRPQVVVRAALPPQHPAASALPEHTPGPLAAAAYARPVEEAVAAFAPRPLPSDFRAAADVLLSDCAGHACAFAVWRSLANLPPRPLPARAYGQAFGSRVA